MSVWQEPQRFLLSSVSCSGKHLGVSITHDSTRHEHQERRGLPETDAQGTRTAAELASGPLAPSHVGLGWQCTVHSTWAGLLVAHRIGKWGNNPED